MFPNSPKYLVWSLQVKAFLDGYGLGDHLNASAVIPPATLTVGQITTPNPAHTKRNCQDKLIYSALLGTILLSFQSVVFSSSFVAQIWTNLAFIYAKPSHGHIKQLKTQLKHFTKGTKNIDEYVQGVKTRLDQLAILDKPYDHEDAGELILEGLTKEYKHVVYQIEAKDTPLFLPEVHKQLLNHEAKLLSSLVAPSMTPLLITANNVQQCPHCNSNFNTNPRPFNSRRSKPPSPSQQPPQSRIAQILTHLKPYLGKCQFCNTQDHSACRCPQIQSLQSAQNPDSFSLPRLWLPHAYMAVNMSYSPDNWLMDFGATHHIIYDLNNLSLHQAYDGGDDLSCRMPPSPAIRNRT